MKSLFRALKYVLFGKWPSTYTDVEMNKTIKLEILNEWYIATLSSSLVFNEESGSTSVRYVEDGNRLELTIDEETSPANITSRSCTTINSRLKKAGKEIIPKELFEEWETGIIEAQGKGKGTYHSVRFPKKK